MFATNFNFKIIMQIIHFFDFIIKFIIHVIIFIIIII